MILRSVAASAVAFGLLALPLLPRMAGAEGVGPLSRLAGSWGGSGTARFEGGQSERLNCRGHYTIKAGGSGVGLALRCASASAKIDMRSSLVVQNGRVTGSWEERTFNAMGSVSGKASPGSLSLANSGGGLSGSMSMTFTGSSQSVRITASGTSLKGVSINLRRI
jgi:hypothetical protein